MRFSVIIPNLNNGKYLSRCIKSILAQTFTDYELLIVDDGSTDDSMKVISSFGINPLKSALRGCGGARNVALDVAKGEYIVFIDADDSLRDEKVLEIINNHITDEDMVLVGWTWIEGEEKYRPPPPPIKEILLSSDPYMAVWSKIWRRDFIKWRFPEQVVFEDVTFTARGYINAKKITALRYNCYNYYRRKDSISSDDKVKRGDLDNYRLQQKQDIQSIIDEYPEFNEYLTWLK